MKVVHIGDTFIYNGTPVTIKDIILGTSEVVITNGQIVDFSELHSTNEGNSMILPTDAAERKCIPITSGVLDYFPLAIAEVAKASYAGNQQHHPNEPLFWDKSKSTDHADCIARHLIDRGKVDSDGVKHSAKLAWRALALLQIELENEKD